MKKLSKMLVVMAAAVMVIGSTLSVSAATSTATVSATASDVSAVTAVTESGEAVTVSAVTETQVVDAQKAAVSLLGQETGSLQVEKCFELTAAITQPTNITIAVPGVTAGQKVAVLHQRADGTWESVPVVSVSAGSVTATFTSLSPVAVVTYVAPKTGTVVSVAGIISLLTLCAAAFCAKKYVKNFD